MPSKISHEPPTLLALAPVIMILTGCPEPEPEPQQPAAPEPIGPELMRIEGTWAWPTCASSHLYRDGRLLQRQCFDRDEVFSWENRGMLTPEAAAALDVELATAELDDRTPVNYHGLCDNLDTSGTITIWFDAGELSFAPFCLYEGILDAFELVDAIGLDIAECRVPSQWLESYEPGCRAY